jgi:arylsulfatase A-like enzyme
VRQQKALMPDKPFFMYFAPGATHAPQHNPSEWIAKYKGAFDDGWDKLREATFAQQKELGVIPADAELTKRHDEGNPSDTSREHCFGTRQQRAAIRLRPTTATRVRAAAAR